jgi:hypothetical protein
MKEEKPITLYIRIQVSERVRKVYLVDVKRIKKLRQKSLPDLPAYLVS